VWWHRSDSPEAFYGCRDVLLGESQPDPDPPDPDFDLDPPDPSPDLDAPGGSELEARIEITDDWGAGYCATGAVTNDGGDPIAWESVIASGGSLTASWNGEFSGTHVHEQDSKANPVRVVSAEWNRVLAGGESTSFGFCADRTTESDPGADPDPEAPVEDVSLEVTTTTDWAPATGRTPRSRTWPIPGCSGKARCPPLGQINSIWNAVQRPAGADVMVSGASWNRTLAAGGSTSLGYCAVR
jgi:cellulase/cellobiase CelA1